MNTNPYHGVDKVFVITLKDEPLRHQHITRLFTHLDIPFEFYKVDRHPRGGLVGCFTSHVGVCSLALQRGYSRVLIFEDDVIPTPSYDPRIIEHVSSFMDEHPDWEMIQLGSWNTSERVSETKYKHDPWKMFIAPRKSRYIYQYCGVLAHAYFISRGGMQKIVANAPAELARKHVPHYDFWFQAVLSKHHCYSVFPMLFDQQWCFQTSNTIVNMAEGLTRPTLCSFSRHRPLYMLTLLIAYREYIVIAMIAFCTVAVVLIRKYKVKA